jgi:hypothetical protein
MALRNAQQVNETFLGLGRVFWEEISIESVGSLRKIHPPHQCKWAPLIHFGPHTTKRQKKGKFVFSAGAGISSFLALRLQTQIGSYTSHTHTHTHTHIHIPTLAPIHSFSTQTELLPILPGFLTCRWQILGLPSLHIHRRQFLMTTHFLHNYLSMYLFSISCWFSFSEEL